MINKNLLIIGIIVLVSSCNYISKTGISEKDPFNGTISYKPHHLAMVVASDSNSKAWGVDSILASIDSFSSQYCDSIHYFELTDLDTLKLSLYIKDNKPIKLNYSTFDDSGHPVGFNSFYFLNGSVYAMTLNYLSYKSVDCFNSTYMDYVKYIKKSSSRITIQKLDEKTIQFRSQDAHHEIDKYMNNFNKYQYKFPDIR